MARNDRDEKLVRKSLSYKMFGKRYCDLSPEEKREFMRIYKQNERAKNKKLIEKESAYHREWYYRRKQDGSIVREEGFNQ